MRQAQERFEWSAPNGLLACPSKHCDNTSVRDMRVVAVSEKSHCTERRVVCEICDTRWRSKDFK